MHFTCTFHTNVLHFPSVVWRLPGSWGTGRWGQPPLNEGHTPSCSPHRSKAGTVVLPWAQTALPGRTWRLCQPKARSHPATSGAVPAIAHSHKGSFGGKKHFTSHFSQCHTQAMKRGLLSKPVLRRGKWVWHFRSCFKMPAGRWRKEAQMEMPAAEDTDASRSACKESRTLAKAPRGAKRSTNKGGSTKTTASHTCCVASKATHLPKSPPSCEAELLGAWIHCYAPPESSTNARFLSVLTMRCSSLIQWAWQYPKCQRWNSMVINTHRILRTKGTKRVSYLP